MTNRFKLTILYILLFCTFPYLSSANNSSIEYIKFFSSLESRVPGFSGHKEASNFIERKFKEIGLSKIRRDNFDIAIPVQEYAFLTISGKEVKLDCLWPNLVRTSTVSPEGITGKIIYAGKGDWNLINGKDIEGNIILLDFDSGNIWQTLAMMGAKAFIFTNTGTVNRVEANKKFVDTPIDVPRFYTTDTQVLLDIASKDKEVKLFARMTWRHTEDYNIYGYIEGRDNDLKDEIIMIQSYYDSISVVPSLSPGASSSVGISSLLEIAEYFKANPPKRTLLFLATSSHFHTMKGMNDFIQKHMRKEPPFSTRIPEEDRIKVSLFIGLELSDKGTGLGVWHNSPLPFHQRAMTSFAKQFMDYSALISKQFNYNPEFSLVNGSMPEKGRVWNTFLASPLKTDGEYVIYGGTPALSLITANDGRWSVDTPADTFDKINTSNVIKQTFFLKKLIEVAVNDPALIPHTELDIKDTLTSLTVNAVTFDPKTSFVPKDPVKNALVVPRFEGAYHTAAEKNFTGVKNNIVSLADEKGQVLFSMLRKSSNATLSSFLIEEETGEISLASDLGSGGAQQYPIKVWMDYKEKSWIHVLFEAKAVGIFELIDPQYLTSLNNVDVFDRANSAPIQYGAYIRPVFKLWTSDTEHLAVVFAKPDIHIKVLGISGLLGKRLLLLNSREKSVNQEEAEGMGFAVTDYPNILNTPYQGAKDMDALSVYRRKNFEKYGIKNDRLAILQEESMNLLKQADEARMNKQWYNFLKFSRQALSLESRAYPDVKNTANDVVKGIIFYFMLLLPFAYFAERLLFGFAQTEKQIAGISGIFLVIYLIMRSVHPAFKLTAAPEVILLSFIVLTLSGVVISIIASKFEEQMQQMKMASTNVYDTDVGRITATATAFSLGVANMKRRKIRTALTSTTLILLTFTVLSFTSIKTQMKYNKVLRPYAPSYGGILFRNRSHSPITHTVFSYVENEFSSQGNISPRAWYILGDVVDRTAIDIISGDKSFVAMGLLGLSPKEILPFKSSLKAGDWFDSDDEDSIIISYKSAEQLGLTSQDVGKESLYVYGKKFLLKGLFDSESFNNIKDLDNELVTPVNFSVLPELELAQVRSSAQRASDISDVTMETLPRVESENIAIMPYTTVMNMGGTLNSVAINFHKGIDDVAATEGFVSKLAVNIFVGKDNKTYVYSSIGLTSFSGLANLLIPILIAALIVLNTMLGSVYERIREIGTYSAVGLAPVHISSLFLAESLVYAVLGAVSGYLLGQIVVKFLMSAGLLKGLVLNYSSLSAVFATIIIFITVLLSTLYPARKASQMAVPDVTRKWILPEPKGDNWEFEFPFTLNEAEVLGMVTFLNDYYNAYQDISIGNFYTSGAKLKYEKLPSGKNKYILDTEVWLAPFDLAVSQAVKIQLEPMGEYDFYLINLYMQRTSGEENDWKRLNRRFLDSMRKQFLVWRTIHESVKKDYSKKGKELLNIE